MRIRACLIPNTHCKIGTRTWHMRNKNPMILYCKEKIKIEQGYNKKNTQNWSWTNLKQWGILLLFILIKHLIQRSFSKKF